MRDISERREEVRLEPSRRTRSGQLRLQPGAGAGDDGVFVG
jgi:hypothetical protein